MSGLEGMVNLRKLYIDVCNEPVDFSFLESNTKIEEVDVSYCSVRGLESLGTHKSLTHIRLHNTHIDDISWLEGLDNLVALDISKNYGFYDVSVLLELPNLKKLNVKDCTTIKSESSATDVLKELETRGCQIIR